MKWFAPSGCYILGSRYVSGAGEFVVTGYVLQSTQKTVWYSAAINQNPKALRKKR